MTRRADERTYHYLYKITRNDGRFYIGMHSTDNLEDGYFGSGKLITRSIKKYGKEIHEKEILEFHITRNALKEREKEYLTEDLRNNILCMNIAPGGGGGFINDKHQLKCASAGGKKSWFKSLHLMQTPECFKKRAKSLKENGNLFTLGMLGKTHTPEVKDKISKAQTGEGNSQFGTCWICNEHGAMKIKKESLQEYLILGYKSGRKFFNK
jgi:hypothetical protein